MAVNSEKEIRSFIAIELPEEVKAGLSKLQRELKSTEATFVKWVDPQGIHLTLKFLGNIFERQIASIIEVMERASQGISPFSLDISGVGAFPNLKQPRVLWVGISGDLERLNSLHQRLETALVPLGFAKESRPFTAHLTLARLRDESSYKGRQSFGELIARASPTIRHQITVTSISLMKSQLLPTGAIYTRLAEVKLAATN